MLVPGGSARLWGERSAYEPPEPFGMDDLGLKALQHGKGGGDYLLVVSDAVVGGGFDLRRGQIVHHALLGEHVEVLVACGAVERVAEPVVFASLM